MSANICNPDHIKALACFAVSGRDEPAVSTRWLEYHLQNEPAELRARVTWGDRQNVAEVVANILHAENVRSVSYRYSEPATYTNGVATDDLPGICDRPEWIAVSSSEAFNPPVTNPVHVLKLCDCLEYQSCETDDYKSTLAYRVLEAITRVVMLDVALFGRMRSGPFFALLVKRKQVSERKGDRA